VLAQPSPPIPRSAGGGSDRARPRPPGRARSGGGLSTLSPWGLSGPTAPSSTPPSGSGAIRRCAWWRLSPGASLQRHREASGPEPPRHRDGAPL